MHDPPIPNFYFANLEWFWQARRALGKNGYSPGCILLCSMSLPRVKNLRWDVSPFMCYWSLKVYLRVNSFPQSSQPCCYCVWNWCCAWGQLEGQLRWNGLRRWWIMRFEMKRERRFHHGLFVNIALVLLAAIDVSDNCQRSSPFSANKTPVGLKSKKAGMSC